MNLTAHRSDDLYRDFDLQYRWYLQQAGEAVAERYLQALLGTLRLLATQPGLGRQRKFRHPALRGIRSFRLASPFEVRLIFYRAHAGELVAAQAVLDARAQYPISTLAELQDPSAQKAPASAPQAT